jgi:hypothetical protein
MNEAKDDLTPYQCGRIAGKSCNGCGSNTPSTSRLGERSFDLAESLDLECEYAS